MLHLRAEGQGRIENIIETKSARPTTTRRKSEGHERREEDRDAGKRAPTHGFFCGGGLGGGWKGHSLTQKVVWISIHRIILFTCLTWRRLLGASSRPRLRGVVP